MPLHDALVIATHAAEQRRRLAQLLARIEELAVATRSMNAEVNALIAHLAARAPDAQ